MRGWWQEITGLVLPVACAGCGRPRTVLCDACTRSLHGRPAVRVRPEPEPEGLPGVWAAAPYADAVRAALLAHKERGALALAAPLGTALAGAVRAAAAGCGGRTGHDGCTGTGRPPRGVGGGGEGVGALPLVLVPVPSARRAVRARGHDAVRRVAVAAARELRRTGAAVRVVPVLRQCRAVADQAGLDARQRQENLAGALAVVPGGARLLEGARVVLVDDLMTTGSSLAEAARALGDAGTGALPGGAACAFAREGGGAACRFAAGDGDGASAERVASGRWNGGDSAMEPGPFGTRAPDSGRRHDELSRDGLGSLLVGAAVVGASPKAFGINRN